MRPFENEPSARTSKTRMCARGESLMYSERLVGREAERRSACSKSVDEELESSAAARRDPVDALEVEIVLALDAEDGHPPVPRVGEVDRAVGA